MEYTVVNAFTTQYIKKLKNSFNSTYAKDYAKFDQESALNAVNSWDHDLHWTKKLFGYRTVYDFWSDQSFVKRIKKMAVPVLAMYTQDDPLIPMEHVPKQELLANKIVVYREL